MTQTGLMCEALGLFIAKMFGVLVPAPALISIDREFIETHNEKLRSLGVTMCPGVGLGSEYLHGMRQISLDTNFTARQIRDAMLIYALDLIIQNPDRSEKNPNCAFYADRIVAFDFELAFSFIHALNVDYSSWQLAELKFPVDHIFKRVVIESRVDWSPISGIVSSMRSIEIEDFLNLLPTDWTDHKGKILEHLADLADNAVEIPDQLTRSLAR